MTISFQYYKTEGIKAHRQGLKKFEYPSGLTATERSFWVIGWEQEDDMKRCNHA